MIYHWEEYKTICLQTDWEVDYLSAVHNSKKKKSKMLHYLKLVKHAIEWVDQIQDISKFFSAAYKSLY